MADRQASPVAAATLAIVVPGRPPNLGNLRLRWAARHRLVASRKALVRTLARSVLARARLAPAATACLVQATLFLAGVQFDAHDISASLKADIDGLAAAGSAAAVTRCIELRAPAAARRLADGCARLLVEVEAQCEREGCAPGCPLARVVRRVAISAGELSREWGARAGPGGAG